MDKRISAILAACVTAVLVVANPAGSAAGPIADFENALRIAYGDYRNALFASNTNNRDATIKAIASFESKWSALVAKYGRTPPPHFGEDGKWTESLRMITDIVARAKSQVATGDLAAAHETLETIRDVLGALRARNGQLSFSDRIDAFHHAMEQVLTKNYAGYSGSGLTELIEDVAVLAYLGNELKKMPPPDALKSADFTPTLDGVLDAVRELQSAARAGDVARIKSGLSRIKPAFAKLFVKFG